MLVILRLYGDIDIRKVEEYQDIVEAYYPIETIVYGIINNRFYRKREKNLK